MLELYRRTSEKNSSPGSGIANLSERAVTPRILPKLVLVIYRNIPVVVPEDLVDHGYNFRYPWLMMNDANASHIEIGRG